MTATTTTTALTPATLRSLALAGGGYATPGLNECLYAGGAGLGWGSVVADDGSRDGGSDGSDDEQRGSPAAPLAFAALAPYTALRALHLDRNGLAGDLAGWPALPHLAALHLADNALRSVAGLVGGGGGCGSTTLVPALALLDVSGNQLTSLDTVTAAAAASLTCLRAARNPLGGGGGEECGGDGSSDSAHNPLATLPSAARLVSLDLEDCGLDDGRALLAALASLPALRCLAAGGNPADVPRGQAWVEAKGEDAATPLPSRRLALAAAVPGLTYLDDAPVFGGERAAADAWAAGGGAPGAAAARSAWAAAEARRRGELQGGPLVDAAAARARAAGRCLVVEVPDSEDDGGEGEEEACAGE
jgi:hypothetical protein